MLARALAWSPDAEYFTTHAHTRPPTRLPAAVCAAGFGVEAPATTCQQCPRNSYQPGGARTCLKCPSTTFQDWVGGSYISYGITFQRAISNPDACVPRYAALPNPAGDFMVLPAGMLTSTATYSSATHTEAAAVKKCVEDCPRDKCCIAEMQREVGGLSCFRAELAPAAPLPAAATTGARLFYKLPPSLFAAASTDDMLSVKTISSGLYAICDINTWAADARDGKVGTSTDPTKVQVANHANWTECTTVAACKAMCDASAPCWGFVQVASKGFALRGGEMTEGARTFFASPDAAGIDYAQLQWVDV